MLSPGPSSSASAPAKPPETVVQAAAYLLSEGRAAEAAARLEPLTAAAPAYPAALVLLARAYEAAGRTDDALEAWHRAHFLVPNSPLVRRERQRLLEARLTQSEGAHTAEVSTVDLDEGDHRPGAPFDVTLGATGGLEVKELEAEAVPEPMPEGGVERTMAPETMTETEAEGALEAALETEPLEPPEVFRPLASDEPVTTVAEAEVAPPEVDAAPAEAVVGDPESEAAWWRRAAGPAAPEDQEAEAGWTLLEETEAPRRESGLVEVRVVAPDDEPAPPDAESDGEAVEEAHELPLAESPSGEGPPVAPGVGAASRGADGSGVPLAEELDALIRRLEDAPRIRPDPSFRSPDVAFDEEIADDMVSETLARIYAAQRQYAEAAIVYEKLARQKPEQAEALLQRAAEMRAQGGER